MRFYFFRHSFKGPDGRISDEGRALAKETGERHGLPEKRIKDLLYSFKGRTLETGVHLLGGLAADRLIATGALDTPYPKEWDDHIQLTEGRPDPDQAFIIAERIRMRWEFVEQSKICPASGNVLVVGHAGLLEVLIYGLTGVMLCPLRECEGAIVDMTNVWRGESWYDESSLVKELRR